MSDFLFQPRSPLIGWFILMELLTAGCIIGFWVEFFCGGMSPWDREKSGPMVIVTMLFVISNALLFRHRRWAILSFVVCWLSLALVLLPTI
ncbi:MAG TPA: hypothetical protein VMA13_08245 [Candidatus Saccharimonadales bacterium]|nr:hypothetical protein [Candidatus Saccharimonadales bacterium]